MSKGSDKQSTGTGRYGRSTTDAGSVRGAAALEVSSAELLLETVCALCRSGDALMISSTRDGGAVAFNVLSGDFRDTLYAATTDEIEDTLRHVLKVASE